MKAYYTLIIILVLDLFSGRIDAQISSWAWARGSTVAREVEGSGAVSDLSNNVYYTGSFIDYSINFGNLSLSDPLAQQQYYLVKYSGSGNPIWARSITTRGRPGRLRSAGLSVSTDNQNNVFVSGFYYGDTLAFDSVNRIIDTASYAKAFLVKYDSSGNVQWSKNIVEGYNISVNGMTNDALGNTYLTGSAQMDSSAIFYQYYQLNALFNDQSQFSHYFIKKYSPSGLLQWTKTTAVDTPYVMVGHSVRIDNSSNIFVTGIFSGDSVNFGGTTLYSSGRNNPSSFLAKYNSAGNLIWVKALGSGRGATNSYSVTTDADNNAYITGSFTIDSIHIGPFALYNRVVGISSFIAKYDSSGDVLWAKSPGGNGNNFGLCIAAEQNGNVYVSGGFSVTTTFDSVILTEPAAANDPMYLVTLDASGKVLCALSLPSGGDDKNTVCIDHRGNAYVSGDYWDSLFIVGHDSLIGSSLGVIELGFVAKYRCGSKSSTGDEDVNNDANIKVYPNPSSGIFYFSGLKDGNTIEIYDLLGQPVRISSNKGDHTINLAGKSTGVYFYKVLDEGSVIQQGKMVVE
jgi:hypothetical protein